MSPKELLPDLSGYMGLAPSEFKISNAATGNASMAVWRVEFPFSYGAVCKVSDILTEGVFSYNGLAASARLPGSAWMVAWVMGPQAKASLKGLMWTSGMDAVMGMVLRDTASLLGLPLHDEARTRLIVPERAGEGRDEHAAGLASTDTHERPSRALGTKANPCRQARAT